MSQKIWVTGDAVVDLIPDGENHYLRCAGGAPANVAVGVARLGSPSAFIGRVGNDPLWPIYARYLKCGKCEYTTYDFRSATSHLYRYRRLR